VFNILASEGTGSSTFVARAMLLEDPPSIDAREVTDKGSINQKVVLAHRAALVDELYSASPSSRVLSALAPPKPLAEAGRQAAGVVTT
jgi:feruloyl-CoA synthase